jgi:hypothetical protein
MKVEVGDRLGGTDATGKRLHLTVVEITDEAATPATRSPART